MTDIDSKHSRQPAPQQRSLLSGVVAALLLALLGFGIWRWMDGGTPLVSGDGRAPAPSQPVGTDVPPAAQEQYLSGIVTLRVDAGTQVRDWPSAAGGQQLRTIGQSGTLTGRWVRGSDGQSRWLRLPDGGYVAAASLQETAPTAPPMQLAISNSNCTWGRDFDEYHGRAQALIAQAEAAQGAELESLVVRVPGRRWRGLMVGGVAALYGGAGIIFREPVAEVRRALEAAGVRVQADGTIPLGGEQVIVQRLESTTGGTMRYGATMLRCGS